MDKQLKDIFNSVFGAQEITMESTIENVTGWDSLGHFTLIGEVERQYNIKFGFDEIVLVNGVKSLVELLRKRGINI